MNKITTIMAAACILLAACKEKKATQDIIVSRQEVPWPQAPISMQEYCQRTDIEWQGTAYCVEIMRTPVDTMPMVKDETGQQFVDNRISLTIMRRDSTVFFQRTFTKRSFNSYLDEDYRRNGILEAMIFEEADDRQLEFAVSIAHPQSEDEFIPLEMKITADGGIAIKRDNDIDINGNDDDDDDDD